MRWCASTVEAGRSSRADALKVKVPGSPRSRTAVWRTSGHAATRTTTQGNGVDPPDCRLASGQTSSRMGRATKALPSREGWEGMVWICRHSRDDRCLRVERHPHPGPPLEGEGKEHCGFSGQQCAFAGTTDRDDLFRPSLKRLRRSEEHT